MVCYPSQREIDPELPSHGLIHRLYQRSRTAEKLVLPLYVAVIVCTPKASVEVVNFAIPGLCQRISSSPTLNTNSP